MEKYKNVGNDSNVTAYEIGNDQITVQFIDGSIYLYNYSRTGELNIEKMKKLAIAGQGLNSFINNNVRKLYVRKLK